MTITTEPVPLSYDGDDSTVDFAITWKYFAKSDVVVTLRDANDVETVWAIDTDYTLTDAGAGTGGTLSATTAPATGETLVIDLAPPNTQDSALPLGGPLPSETIEDELDQAAQRDAKLEQLFNRAMLVPKTDTQTGSLLDLAIDATRANKFLAFDANGAPIMAAGTSANLKAVSAFVDTLLDDADAPTFLTTLLVTAYAQTLLLAADAPTTRDLLGINTSAAQLENLGLAASVNTSALTITVTTQDVGTPTAADSVLIGFRNATNAVGDYLERTIEAALNIVVPKGATLGFANSETGFIYVYALDQAGTIEVAVAKQAIFDENKVQSTTVLDTSSDSATVLYSTIARSNVAIRLMGRCKIQTGAVAGDWDNEDTVLTVWTPAMKKTGDVIQSFIKQDGAVATGTTLHILDDTFPENTEGDQYLSQAITPTDAVNILEIDALVSGSSSVANTDLMQALYQDAIVNALKASVVPSNAVGEIHTFPLFHRMAAGATSAITFNIRAGGADAGTFTFNGAAGGRIFAGVMNSYLRVKEIQA